MEKNLNREGRKILDLQDRLSFSLSCSQASLNSTIMTKQPLVISVLSISSVQRKYKVYYTSAIWKTQRMTTSINNTKFLLLRLLVKIK